MTNKPDEQKQTKVFRLQIDRNETYDLYVEAESAEQAREAWEATNYEAGAMIDLRDRTTQGEEELTAVYETDQEATDADFDYNRTLDALGIEHTEED